MINHKTKRFQVNFDYICKLRIIKEQIKIVKFPFANIVI